jgi:hypothetical protein
MDFETYHKAIVDRTKTYSSAAMEYRRKRRKPADLEGAKARRVTAAAALVIAERGERWARKNPRAFEASVLPRLGIIANIAITLLGIFSGGGIWLALIKILIPAVVWFLNDRLSADSARDMSYGDDKLRADFSCLQLEATQVLKGTK